jgi:hypothetical protein
MSVTFVLKLTRKNLEKTILQKTFLLAAILQALETLANCFVAFAWRRPGLRIFTQLRL